MTGRVRLERLAAQWRRRRLAGFAVATAAAALLAGGGLGALLNWPPPPRWLAGGAAGIGVIVAGAAAGRRAPTDARRVARHLDRVHPSLEESTALLLEEDASLTALERLQRERVARELARLEIGLLPNRPLRRALAAAAVMLGGAAVLAAAGVLRGAPAASGFVPGPLPPALDSLPPGVPPTIRGLAIEIRPPAYTRRAMRRAGALDIEAPAGSRVTWRITTDQPAGALLVSAGGDTVPFEDGAASLTAVRSMLYEIVLRTAAGLTGGSDLHQLVVVPDRPPVLTVEAPPPRTLLAPGESLRIPVRVVAEDDYGIAGAELLATVTTGRGESVRFREERIAFGRRAPGVRGIELGAVIDLARLGLAPGDELYFHVRATDTRTPDANESRSDTYFIALLDTASIAEAAFAGTPVSRLPEYFRSQRQIIIDTERLLAEQPRLATEAFRDRSNAIGMDQGLLRTRYGALVGDEIAGGEPEETGHMHDTEENATLLAAPVKTTLKAALAEMWQAELKLRTHEPSAALPYEYRALALLKEVQQAARIYVQRAGFEPPPLEPDTKRLTGGQKGIGDRRESREVHAPDPHAALRAALPVLAELGGAAGAPATDQGRARVALDAAGRELADLAADAPGESLSTLRVLRRLLDSLERGRACAACADTVARGIWRLLPPGAPVPRAGAAGSGGLARRYFDRLTEP